MMTAVISAGTAIVAVGLTNHFTRRRDCEAGWLQNLAVRAVIGLQRLRGASAHPQFLACSRCFTDHGLHLDAEQIGVEATSPCPNCGSVAGHKLTEAALNSLAYRFFVWGSLLRCDYGAAPLIQFNEQRNTSIKVSPWLTTDIKLLERLLRVGFFGYGPRLWMVGEVEPLKALQEVESRTSIVERIIREYPSKIVGPDLSFYRIRKMPETPSKSLEYDSPPSVFAETGRFDTRTFPVLYASSDLQVCVHETRVTAEDELYVATLRPSRQLKLLDLSVLLKEDEHVTEFESLDMAVHMLFLAGKHSYEISRAIATSAYALGFDGLIYPSYFSLLRIGVMPFQTAYGLSYRRIPQFQQYEEANAVPNLAIFGRPINDGKVEIECINKLILNRVAYEFHFGPVEV